MVTYGLIIAVGQRKGQTPLARSFAIRLLMVHCGMPRKPRRFEIGRIYHIYNRGADRRKIYLKTQDYHRFILALELFNSVEKINLWTLFRAQSRGGADPPLFGNRLQELREKRSSGKRLVDLLAFALMPNHYHVILQEIAEGGISKFMQKIGGYASYFNLQNERAGSLFQSRYSMVPIESDSQLLIALTYVHTNPIELVEPLWKDEAKVEDFHRAIHQLNTYPFSSYHDYIDNPKFPHVTQREFLRKFFNEKRTVQKETESWIRFKAERALAEGKLSIFLAEGGQTPLTQRAAEKRVGEVGETAQKGKTAYE